mmetsp:Transcript_21239/g.33983  ORF Transcript_21239/g.33983 Transcript_21239/m.33983 type:complete len:200 (-) Transcript_21239:83-682(-)
MSTPRHNGDQPHQRGKGMRRTGSFHVSLNQALTSSCRQRDGKSRFLSSWHAGKPKAVVEEAASESDDGEGEDMEDCSSSSLPPAHFVQHQDAVHSHSLSPLVADASFTSMQSVQNTEESSARPCLGRQTVREPKSPSLPNPLEENPSPPSESRKRAADSDDAGLASMRHRFKRFALSSHEPAAATGTSTFPVGPLCTNT